MVLTKRTSLLTVLSTVSEVVYKNSLLLEDRKTASYFHFHLVQITLLTTLYVKLVTMSCLVQYSDSEDELSDKEDPDCIGMKRKNPTNFQVCTENNKKLR